MTSDATLAKGHVLLPEREPNLSLRVGLDVALGLWFESAILGSFFEGVS